MFALGAKLCLSQLYESQLTNAAIVHNRVVHCVVALVAFSRRINRRSRSSAARYYINKNLTSFTGTFAASIKEREYVVRRTTNII